MPVLLRESSIRAHVWLTQLRRYGRGSSHADEQGDGREQSPNGEEGDPGHYTADEHEDREPPEPLRENAMPEREDGRSPGHGEDAGAEEPERVPAEREECLRHHLISAVVVDGEQCLLGESLDQVPRG